MRGGKVVAREVATVVSNADIATIVKSPKPAQRRAAGSKMLKGDDYVRVWINRGGQNYLIHLPATAHRTDRNSESGIRTAPGSD